jgi:hypothetical protein
MSVLLPFIFNTLRTRAIDPHNKRFFLPTVLAGISGKNSHGKLIPIEQDSWSIGPITGPAGATVTDSFINNWATFLEKVQKVDLSNQFPIADPRSPSPVLDMGDGGKTKIVINGLQNVFVEPNPTFVPNAQGYHVNLALQFNHWDGSAGRPNIPQLSMSGPYQLSQSLCLANNGASVCNGNASTDIHGDGTVALNITDAFVDAQVQLSVASHGSAGREAKVTVLSLLVRGADPSTPPTIDVTDLTIGASVSDFLKNVWKTAALNAIQSDDGRAGIFRNLNAALNEASNLASLSQQMTTNLASALDSAFGATKGTLPNTQAAATTNPIDRYIFDRVGYAVNEPTSALFLPLLLCKNDNPSLSPLVVAQVGLPDFDIVGAHFQQGKLLKLHFNGLTNVKAAQSDMVLGNSKFQFDAALGGWNPPPRVSCAAGIPAPPATGTSQFVVSAQGMPTPLTGDVGVTVNGARLKGTCSVSGTSDATMDITVHSLTLVIPDLAGGMQINLNIESAFKNFINSAINTSDNHKRIIDNVNSTLSQHYQDIGKEVTKFARDGISRSLQ